MHNPRLGSELFRAVGRGTSLKGFFLLRKINKMRNSPFSDGGLHWVWLDSQLTFMVSKSVQFQVQFQAHTTRMTSWILDDVVELLNLTHPRASLSPHFRSCRTVNTLLLPGEQRCVVIRRQAPCQVLAAAGWSLIHAVKDLLPRECEEEILFPSLALHQAYIFITLRTEQGYIFFLRLILSPNFNKTILICLHFHSKFYLAVPYDYLYLTEECFLKCSIQKWQTLAI